jgi:hypothetical protein
MHQRREPFDIFTGGMENPCVPVKHIVRDALSTWVRRSRMNNDHDELISLSAKVKAIDTIWSSGSTAAAIIKVPLYFSVKKVPSTRTTGLQNWKACSV